MANEWNVHGLTLKPNMGTHAPNVRIIPLNHQAHHCELTFCKYYKERE